MPVLADEFQLESVRQWMFLAKKQLIARRFPSHSSQPRHLSRQKAPVTPHHERYLFSLPAQKHPPLLAQSENCFNPKQVYTIAQSAKSSE